MEEEENAFFFYIYLKLNIKKHIKQNILRKILFFVQT